MAELGTLSSANVQTYLRPPFPLWEPEEHVKHFTQASFERRGDTLFINGLPVQLAYVPQQKPEGEKGDPGRQIIEVERYLRNRTDYSLLDISLLNFLIDHPFLIPDDWDPFSIHFFGTVYTKRESVQRRVFYLRKLGGKWGRCFTTIRDKNTLGKYEPAAVILRR